VRKLKSIFIKSNIVIISPEDSPSKFFVFGLQLKFAHWVIFLCNMQTRMLDWLAFPLAIVSHYFGSTRMHYGNDQCLHTYSWGNISSMHLTMMTPSIRHTVKLQTLQCNIFASKLNLIYTASLLLLEMSVIFYTINRWIQWFSEQGLFVQWHHQISWAE